MDPHSAFMLPARQRLSTTSIITSAFTLTLRRLFLISIRKVFRNPTANLYNQGKETASRQSQPSSILLLAPIDTTFIEL